MPAIPDGDTDPIVATDGEDHYRSTDSIGDLVAEQPLTALAIAAVFGFIVGKLIL